MSFIPSAITQTVGRTVLKGKKNSPAILLGAGVVGMVGTVVTASKATLQLETVLEDTIQNAEKAKTLRKQDIPNYTEEDYNKDMAIIRVRGALAVAKLYAPAVSLGLLSIAAFTSSHVILTKRNAALAAAYTVLEKGFNEYRQRVEDEFGTEKEREFRYGRDDMKVKDEETGKTVNKKMVGPDGNSIYARFFDEYSRNWEKTPEYNLLFLRGQQQFANDMLHSRGHLFLNEVYDMLGIDRSKAGQVVGWVVGPEGDNFVDFGIFDRNREGARDFVNGREGSILLDFNVDGVVYDKI